MNFYQQDDRYIQNLQVDAKAYSEKLPSGTYKVKDIGGMMETKFAFTPVPLQDRLVEFSNGPIGEVLDKIPPFFNDDTISGYKEMGVSHKMGLLLYGPPGTGKTVTSRMLMSILAEKYDAICLMVTGNNPLVVKRVVDFIRKIQSNPIVLFFDEFESLCRQFEDDLLTFLDGENSIDGCITLACTNFLDKVPERIRLRKSRIKHLIEIKSLPMSVYSEFIHEKLPSLSQQQCTELAYKAENECLTLDQVKHVLIDYRIDRKPFDESILAIKAIAEKDLSKVEKDDSDAF